MIIIVVGKIKIHDTSSSDKKIIIYFTHIHKIQHMLYIEQDVRSLTFFFQLKRKYSKTSEVLEGGGHIILTFEIYKFRYILFKRY